MELVILGSLYMFVKGHGLHKLKIRVYTKLVSILNIRAITFKLYTIILNSGP